MASLSPQERSAGNEAVDYDASSVISRDLLFDENMGLIKNQLEDSGDATELSQLDIPAELKTALNKAALIYRKHLWQNHDQENRRWIVELQPLVDKYGEKLKNSLVSIYGQPWPGQPVRVDVTIYAGQFGAYTTNGPTRPTISSRDLANQDIAALEVVFHETSHGMIRKVADAISSAESEVSAHNRRGPSMRASSGMPYCSIGPENESRSRSPDMFPTPIRMDYGRAHGRVPCTCWSNRIGNLTSTAA